MTSSEYNDNRPQDGQDEREQRRMEKEFDDLDTLQRFTALICRLWIARLVPDQTYWAVMEANVTIEEALPTLLDKEGF